MKLKRTNCFKSKWFHFGVNTMVAGLIALSLHFFQVPIEESQIFVIGFQRDTLKPKSLEKIRTCTKPEQLIPILSPLGYEAIQHAKGIIFIFKSSDKLDKYIAEKKKLMEFYVQAGAGERTKPWEKTFKVKQLPEFWSTELSSLTRTTVNTGVDLESPIVPQLNCRVTLKSGDNEVITEIRMQREVTTSYKEKLRSISPIEGGGVKPDNNRFPRDPDAAYAAMPFVNFTLNGFATEVWGTSMTNSKAAGVMEAYFKQLRVRTEASEEKLRSLYREFFKNIEGQDPLWKDLRSMNGRPASEMSPELQSALISNLLNNKSSRFQSEQEIKSFLASAQVVKTNPMMFMYLFHTDHNGGFNTIGFEF